MDRRDFLLGSASLGATTRAMTATLAAAEPSRPLLLVHGAMHGAWCWYRMMPRLRAAGFDARAVDLPGRGRNPAPREAQTRDAYVDSIVSALDQAPAPAVLIGHDVGGLLITLAADRRPAKIACLIYLAAFMPRSGESLMALALRDTQSLVRHRTVVSRDRSSIDLRQDSVREVLYADCGDEDVALAGLSLVPEATQPFGAPVSYSQDRLDGMARRYVFCEQDRAVGIGLQHAMFEALGGGSSVALDCGHSPFFSTPDRLATAIMKLAA